MRPHENTLLQHDTASDIAMPAQGGEVADVCVMPHQTANIEGYKCADAKIDREHR